MNTERMRKRLLAGWVAGLLVSLVGCQSHPLPSMPMVEQVDIPRFMGRWYVIAHIPTFLEREVHNAVETYALNPDGSIATTFTYLDGGFDGKPGRMTPTGYVRDTRSNALWGMEFIWPIEADYRIVYLAPDYSLTVIGREKRDYVWVMARTPRIPEPIYQDLASRIASWGYDVAALRRVPQRWPTSGEALP
ncbi:MAG: lipocalin family protein [Pseudomonadota bacterium]